MKKEIKVISLGGSLIIPDQINLELIEEFKEVLLKNKDKYKFVIVCGGGKTARNYIDGLDKASLFKKEYFQSQLGISATRLNARFLTYFFKKDANYGIPHSMIDVKNSLLKNDIVFCGALRQGKRETSDSTAARLARFLETDFINITNVTGLYDVDPNKYKDAEFIREISYLEFYNKAKKIKYHPGQHFVLDQDAAKMIMKYKIPTSIIGPDMKNLERLLNKEHFVGTVIGR